MEKLTHTDNKGRANMVDVGGKIMQRRLAKATGTVLGREMVKSGASQAQPKNVAGIVVRPGPLQKRPKNRGSSSRMTQTRRMIS